MFMARFSLLKSANTLIVPYFTPHVWDLPGGSGNCSACLWTVFVKRHLLKIQGAPGPAFACFLSQVPAHAGLYSAAVVL